MSATTEGLPQRTVAQMHRNRWPGWIWAVPLAAVAIVVWLVVRQISGRGVTVTVTFRNAAQMKADTTQVIYRGVVVGKVSQVSLASDGSKAVVGLSIQDEDKKYLRAGTHFYLEGAIMSLSDPASLKAIVAGPTIQMSPGDGAPTRSFVGLTGEAPEDLAIAIPYRINFDGEVGELKAGTSVMLRGFKVGEVTGVDLGVDPVAGTIHTAAEVALDPSRFHLRSPLQGQTWSSIMNTTLQSLIAHNLRARLAQSPPLVGPRQVELAFVPEAAPASFEVSDGLWEIPATKESGIDHLIKAAGQIPLKEIGDNVRAISEHIKTLSSSPALNDSIVHLDSALKELDQTLRTAGPEVAPTIQSVHNTVEHLNMTADELDKTVIAARSVLGNEPAAPDGSLEPTLLHVSEAARAIRELADYLDAHPESLIKGRRK